MEEPKLQVLIDGQMYDIEKGCIRVDREKLIRTRLEDIPIDVMVRCDRDIEGPLDIGGLRNLGEGKFQVFVRFLDSKAAEAPLSDHAYYKATSFLVSLRKDKVGDVCEIHVIDHFNWDIPWVGINISGNSIEELFEKALEIADEIAAPLKALEEEVNERIYSF